MFVFRRLNEMNLSVRMIVSGSIAHSLKCVKIPQDTNKIYDSKCQFTPATTWNILKYEIKRKSDLILVKNLVPK